MDTLTITIHNTVEGEAYFNVVDDKGEKLLTSKQYDDTSDCLRDIYMIQRYKDFEIADDPASRICHYRFCLQTPSGNVLATSARYYAAARMQQDKEKINAGIMRAGIEDHRASVKFFRPVVKYGR